MDHFQYQEGVLRCESVDLRKVAAEHGTPTFVYSSKTLLDHYDRIKSAFSPLNATICYSVKSCQNLSILRLLQEHGAAFDVVSAGELSRTIEAGADTSRIVFAGVGKSDSEILAALKARIAWFNVESEEELGTIAALAEEVGITGRIALRVNPDIDPQTHRYTATGKQESKFGIDPDRVRRLFAEYRHSRSVELAGIHLHIGSLVNTIGPYEAAIAKTLALISQLRADGMDIRTLNIGGGFGAHYQDGEAPPATAYAKRVVPLLEHSGLEILLEPGRSISANAGVLLTRTLYTKDGADRRFIIVDAGMTELIRPALYGAHHFVWPIEPRDGLVPEHRSANQHPEGTVLADVVGPICESGDFIAKERWLPPVARGDLLCVFSAGAYGFVMSSQYNSRPRAAEVLVDGSTCKLIRRRETYDDLVDAERL